MQLSEPARGAAETRAGYRNADPHIRAHALKAIKAGWPRILVINRPGVDARRKERLANIPTRKGDDRDEYPPDLGRGRSPGLTKGTTPTGWRCVVRAV